MFFVIFFDETKQSLLMLFSKLQIHFRPHSLFYSFFLSSSATPFLIRFHRDHIGRGS